MKELSKIEVLEVSGGKPKFMNFVFGGVIGGIVGLVTGGPAGMAIGIYTGLASAGVKEAAFGLVEITHPQYGVNQ